MYGIDGDWGVPMQRHAFAPSFIQRLFVCIVAQAGGWGLTGEQNLTWSLPSWASLQDYNTGDGRGSDV